MGVRSRKKTRRNLGLWDEAPSREKKTGDYLHWNAGGGKKATLREGTYDYRLGALKGGANVVWQKGGCPWWGL